MKHTYHFLSGIKAVFTCTLSATAFIASAQFQPPFLPAPCEIYASEVVFYNPKKCKDGSDINAALSNPEKALFAPQDSDQPGPVNYVALGFGGYITLKLSAPLVDGKGYDFEIVETTYNNICARYPEKAEVFVSQDGCNFVCLGIACHNGMFDLTGTGLDWIQYVKIHDVSPITHHYNGQGNANGYDVDGIRCLNGIQVENPVLNEELLVGAPRTSMNYLPSNPQTIAENRRNPDNATGFPEGGNGSPVTFTSLGFGGEVTLVFDYVVFDQEGPDLFVTETSGAANYPERAQFFGSSCGIDWIELTSTEDGITLEQDGWIDFNGNLYALKYLRIVDRSRRSQFGGGADGYDVDGVVSLNNCGNVNEDTRIADNTATQDEVTSISVSPNPFKSDLRLDIATSNSDNTAVIEVYNFLGQQVFSSRINVASSSNVSEVLNLGDLKTGVYFVTVETNTSKETIKLIKQ